jgi:small subunit ribosomal protein S6
VAKKKQERKKIEDSRLREYELVYILNPDIDDEALETRVNGISQFITGREGVVDSVDKWGKRRLAYPLKHFLEGNYVLAKFKLSPGRCKELDASLKITEEVLRHLLIRVGA